MNMAVRVWDNQPIDEEYMKRVEENFTGLNYFRMCPDGEKVREHLLAAQESARDSSLLEGEDSYPYRVVKTTMEEITK